LERRTSAPLPYPWQAYGISYLGGIGFLEDARQVPLSRFRLHCGERFRYEYDFIADWKLDIRLERALLFDPDRALPSCIGGSRAEPPEDCVGALDYLKRLDWHRSHLPIDELNIMVEAVRRFVDADGNRHAVGDLDELRDAVDRVKDYQDFQPDKFDRRELNRRLRALTRDREVRRMICKIQVVTIGEDGCQETLEIACLERTDLKPETLGLTLAEAKLILKDLQQIVVECQVSSSLLLKQACPDCGEPRCPKGNHTLLVRTVFGQLAHWPSCFPTAPYPNCFSWKPSGPRS
jgi:hypothetical protein